MTDTNFLWPTREDYDNVVENKLRDSVFDADLSTGRLARSHSGSILQLGGANLYVCLYRIESKTRSWVMRCFCSTGQRTPPEDILERYEAISQFCLTHSQKVSALLPISFIKDGIEVDLIKRDEDKYIQLDRAKFSFVKMPFVHAPSPASNKVAPSLGSFIAANHDKQAIMSLLCKAWLNMLRELEEIGLAHGDLDLSNVLVLYQPQLAQLSLKLIDYDNVWIPALSRYPQLEYGHEPFQHPAFFPPHERPYNAQMDRFSALTIYISLLALTARPDLYRNEEWSVDDNHLLFSSADYRDEQEHHSSPRIEMLSSMQIAGLKPYLAALKYSLHNNCMPASLQEIATQKPIQQPVQKPVQQPSYPKVIPPKRNPAMPPIDKTYSISYTDWNTAEYYKKEDEPLIPVKPSAGNTSWPRPSHASSPDLHTSLPQEEVNTFIPPTYDTSSYDAPTAPNTQSMAPQFQRAADPSQLQRDANASPTQQPSSQREARLGCLIIAAVAVLVIIVLVLVITHFSGGHAQIMPSTYPSLARQAPTGHETNTPTTDPLAQMTSLALPILGELQNPLSATSHTLASPAAPPTFNLANSFTLLAAIPALVAAILFLVMWLRQWISMRRKSAQSTLLINGQSPEVRLMQKSNLEGKNAATAPPPLRFSLFTFSRKQRQLQKAIEELQGRSTVLATDLAAQALTSDYALWQQLQVAITRIPTNAVSLQFVKKIVDEATAELKNEVDAQKKLANACYMLICGTLYLNYCPPKSPEDATTLSSMGKAYQQLSTLDIKTRFLHMEAAYDCYALALDTYRLQKKTYEQANSMCEIGAICMNSLPFCMDKIARLRLAIQFYEGALLLLSHTDISVSNTNDDYVNLRTRILRKLNDAYHTGYGTTGNQTYLKQATVNNQQALSSHKQYNSRPEKP